MLKKSKESYTRKVDKLRSKADWNSIKTVANIKPVTDSLSNISSDAFIDYFTSIKSNNDFIFQDFSTLHRENISITEDDIRLAIRKLKKGGGFPFIQLG